jgi:Skp family chaperone for outer membrane proteins
MLIAGIFIYRYYNQCTADAKPQTMSQALPLIGVIDLQRVYDSHPRIKELDSLKSEYEEIKSKLGISENASAVNEIEKTAQDAFQGLKQSLDQKFTTKMQEKDSELKAIGQKKFAEYQKEMEAQKAAAIKAISAPYQTSIFNIRLKFNNMDPKNPNLALKADLEKELARLEAELNAKIMAKENELAAAVNNKGKALAAENKNELEAYRAQLVAQINKTGSARQTEVIAIRNDNISKLISGKDSERSKISSELDAKKNAVMALQNTIIADIRDKTAKVASAQGIEAVIANYQTNVKAIDITEAVILEVKK